MDNTNKEFDDNEIQETLDQETSNNDNPENGTEWVDIARVGTFTPMNGKTETIRQEDFENIINNFNEKKLRIPLVFGHPKTNAPAYGWVEALQVDGDILQARFKQVHEDVKTLVRNGNFKNVSISLAPDKATLLHIGLLGAAAPAIAGLKEVSFANTRAITIDFSMNNAGELARLKNKLAEANQKLLEYENQEKCRSKENIVERIRKTVADGKVMPSESYAFIAFAKALNDAEMVIQFSAGSDPVPASEAFVEMLENRPVNQLAINFADFINKPDLYDNSHKTGKGLDNPAYLV